MKYNYKEKVDSFNTIGIKTINLIWLAFTKVIQFPKMQRKVAQRCIR